MVQPTVNSIAVIATPTVVMNKAMPMEAKAKADIIRAMPTVESVEKNVDIGKVPPVRSNAWQWGILHAH